jgi:hypothetical protein
MPVVLTVDQQGSSAGHDRVPDLLELLAAAPRPPVLRGFQRTAGDEVQGVLTDPGATVETIGRLLRSGGWHVGVGVGPVDDPLPRDARAGRGPAYLHAREAVARAKSGPHRVAVVGEDAERAEQLETVLWLWAGLLERRTDRGWQVHDALAEGLSHAEAGRRLGVTQSAVTQRARSAGLVDERRARRLATHLLATMVSDPSGTLDQQDDRDHSPDDDREEER